MLICFHKSHSDHCTTPPEQPAIDCTHGDRKTSFMLRHLTPLPLLIFSVSFSSWSQVLGSNWVGAVVGGVVHGGEEKRKQREESSLGRFLVGAISYLLRAICYLLQAICYLLQATCYLLRATCYLLKATCYPLLESSLGHFLVGAICYLLRAICYLLQATCYLLRATCYLLVANSRHIEKGHSQPASLHLSWMRRWKWSLEKGIKGAAAEISFYEFIWTNKKYVLFLSP